MLLPLYLVTQFHRYRRISALAKCVFFFFLSKLKFSIYQEPLVFKTQKQITKTYKGVALAIDKQQQPPRRNVMSEFISSFGVHVLDSYLSS